MTRLLDSAYQTEGLDKGMRTEPDRYLHVPRPVYDNESLLLRDTNHDLLVLLVKDMPEWLRDKLLRGCEAAVNIAPGQGLALADPDSGDDLPIFTAYHFDTWNRTYTLVS
jgi:hypothetical protein